MLELLKVLFIFIGIVTLVTGIAALCIRYEAKKMLNGIEEDVRELYKLDKRLKEAKQKSANNDSESK